VIGEASQHHSLTKVTRELAGARARRVVDAPGKSIAEHAHDWPVLSIYVSGSLENVTETGTRLIQSPWVVLYGSRAAHANTVGPHGFEQIEIEFEPDWLDLDIVRDLPTPLHWIGGRVCGAARELARNWSRAHTPEAELRAATRAFVMEATRHRRRPIPPWVATVLATIRDRPETGAATLGSQLGLSPHWLAQSYRAAMGEGIRETARRTRVERAAAMLRTSDLEAARIAAEAGFCDQSHMIRCFLEVLGITPSQIRNEWKGAREN